MNCLWREVDRSEPARVAALRGRNPLFMLAVAGALAIAGCGGGSGSSPATEAMPRPVHTVDLPDAHDLADWLTVNLTASLAVPAGEHRDAGGVRFSCPAGGVDCRIAVTQEDDTVTAHSTGGAATAMLVPPPPVHTVELPGSDTGLANWLEGNPDGGSFIVPAGEHRDVGGMRFSCPAAGNDCEVTVTWLGGVMVTSTGGKASADNNPVRLPADALGLAAFGLEGLSVPAGEFRDVGDVRFSCPADGADCEVTFVFSYCLPGICVDLVPGAVSLGGAATAALVPLRDTAFFKHANDYEEDRVGFPHSANIGAGAKAAARAAEAAASASRVSGIYPSGSSSPAARFHGRASGSSAEDIPATVRLFVMASRDEYLPSGEGVTQAALPQRGRFKGVALSREGGVHVHVWADTEKTRSTADAEWMAFGYWLRTDNPAAVLREDALGAYVAYNKPYPAGADASDLKALTGTAIYEGSSAGIHAKGTDVQPFHANATLRAEFGNATDAGTVSGRIHDIVSGGEALPGEISLGAGAILLSGSGSGIEGSATSNLNSLTVGGSEISGGWEAQFLGERPSIGADAAKYPGSVAGTFAVTGGRAGTERQTFLGGFGAYRR